MIKFTPYESLLYIFISLLVILPGIILRFFNKKNRIYNLIVSLFMTILVFGLNSFQLVQFILFVLFEISLVICFNFIRRRCKSEFIYFLIFALSIFPLVFIRLVSKITVLSNYIGFIGISYMCFKIWQILFDIHDERIKKINILHLIELLVFFPSFSSGPIISYNEFNESYNTKINNYFNEYFIVGLKSILIGLFYKFALSYFINSIVLMKISDKISIANVFIYMYFYTLYLFFDFAGYSKLAIGISSMLGIKLPQNFNKPFLACNMKEFWQRWHMSLSNWFNNNVFSRFVLNNVRNGMFKDPKSAAKIGYIFTMVLMGLWHGFSLHYLIYGLYEGILLLITEVIIKTKFYRNFKKKKYYKFVSIIFCFQFISFGMLLFSGKYFFS